MAIAENMVGPMPVEASTDVATDEKAPICFFTTSTLKLVLMSTCTLGFYDLYWFYKNWVRIKAQTGGNIWPFWRTFFATFWTYGCFQHIKTKAQDNNIEETPSVGLLTIAYIALNLCVNLPDPLWLLTFLSVLPLAIVNGLAIQVNSELNDDFENNTRFSVWHGIAIGIGGLLVLLAFIGTFLVEA